MIAHLLLLLAKFINNHSVECLWPEILTIWQVINEEFGMVENLRMFLIFFFLFACFALGHENSRKKKLKHNLFNGLFEVILLKYILRHRMWKSAK